MKYHTKVAGVTFEGRQDIIKNLEAGTALLFERDPENKFDKNAVKVIAEGKHIGFLPKGNWVANEMDQGVRFNAVISQITGGGPGMSYGVNVEYEIAGRLDASQRREMAKAVMGPAPAYTKPKKPDTEMTKLWKLVK